ncbi:transcriptional regulator [Mycolicibacter kumamotonensis]|uniref:transcriptional regulator n=1 Tax=Mycolicibacter kumamotonensis TaxID=354243 RepID=UPI00080668DF|nr:transcriptional regulator [Mycolicibacter kumamotonensis]
MTHDWVGVLHLRVAAAIKKARGNRPAQWLADETERLGHPISRSALANYESGRKKGLDIGELIVIAVALKVPPVALLFPELPDGAVELVPDVPVSSEDALAWFCGEVHPRRMFAASSDDGVAAPAEFKLVEAVRARNMLLPKVGEIFQSVASYRERADEAKAGEFGSIVRSLRERAEQLRDDLARQEEAIVENGGFLKGRADEGAV